MAWKIENIAPNQWHVFNDAGVACGYIRKCAIDKVKLDLMMRTSVELPSPQCAFDYVRGYEAALRAYNVLKDGK